MRTAHRYDSKTDTIVLGNQTTSWAYNREAYKQAGMGSLTDAIFDFAKSMSKMRVDSAEYALLTAIAIFSGNLAQSHSLSPKRHTFTFQSDPASSNRKRSRTFKRSTPALCKRTSTSTDQRIAPSSRVF